MKAHVRELRAGTGTPIVLLHGWLGCGADFEALAAAPEFEGRSIFAIDLPGHGQSPDYDREYGFAEAAEFVADGFPADCVDLVGYSMGGRLALYITGTQPDRIRRLALIAAHPGIEHPVEQRQRLELDSERATDLIGDPAGFLAAWSALELFGPASSEAWRGARSRRQETSGPLAYAWGRALLCLSLGRQLSLWNIPYGVGVPALFVVGSRDEKYVEVAREFKAQNPTVASVALVAGAHHAPHLDRPDAVARRLADFLAVAPGPD